MLTRPFTRLVVAFGVRKITQRRLVEEFVTGTLILIPFGFVVGFITSRICTKIHVSGIRSDVWTTLVVFLIGDILMEWLLPSLGCLPVPAAAPSVDDLAGGDDVEEYGSSMFQGKDSSFRQDEFHYNITWLLQSYGLYCPADFANSDSLLTPDATAILFSIRLIFLCIGVHIGESIGCFVALTGGIATGKSTAAKMFVDYNYSSSETYEDGDEDEDKNKNNHGTGGNANNSNIRNRRNSGKKSNHKKGGGGSNPNNSNFTNTTRSNVDEDDELIKIARANDEGGGLLSTIFNVVVGSVNGFLSAIASFALTDDCSGVVYNEGTVQLICADSIAHNILLPPEVLAERSARTSNLSEGEDEDDDRGADRHRRSRYSQVNDDDDYEDDDENDSGEEHEGNGDGSYHAGAGNTVHGNSEDQTPILKIVSPSDSVYHQIVKAFEGKDILNPNNGQIDRLKLGAIIFNDRDERKKLNRITHPKILNVLLKKLVRSVFFGYADITMGDLPLLFESGKLLWLFGVTICVTTSEEVQLARLMQRNPELPKEECQARINSQMALSKKEGMADIVINNNGDLEQLREQVEEARRDIMGRLYGIGMSLLQMLLLIGGSTSIAVSSKFYTHWQQ
mmetsp:Transcript_13685/g.38522  ORF Transcript_13685/g.38522 Transcript_13685/m.38522 type:complete len:621 (+) Transcript_13685:300-2162(+)